ncbi:MAG: alpha/beta fold hydrolase [Bacilli bacterium]|jgi:hypothetical protein
MPELTKIIIIVGIVLFVIVMLGVVAVNLLMRFAFKKRGDGSPALRYLQSEDFPGLIADPIKFNSNKQQIIRGYLYHKQQFTTFKELIIFAHGIGAGHTSYTTEINRLANEGYLIFAFDYTGCMLSSGTSMKSLIQPLVDLEHGLRYIESRPDLKELKRYVVGHSWGGFVALNSLLLKNHRIDKVVDISGFDSPTMAIVANHKILYAIYPFIFMHGFWRYGRFATYNSSKALKKVKVPVLVVHGKLDRAVKPLVSADKFAKIAQKNSSIEIYYVDDRGHLPYASKRAEEYLHQVKVDKALINPKSPVVDYEIDYKLITEEDEVVMKKIVAFLKK